MIRTPQSLGTLCILFAVQATVLVVVGSLAAAADDPVAAARQQIERLVGDLSAVDADKQAAAEKQLIQLAAKGDEKVARAVLAALPAIRDEMPKPLQERLARAAKAIRTELALRTIAVSRVTLDLDDAPLDEALESLAKQTGNRLADAREKFGQQAGPIVEKRVTLHVRDELFWSTADKLLDAVQMSPYALSGEESLAIVDRDKGELRRFGRGVYSGPFRVEATDVVAKRGQRNPDDSSLQVQLEWSWEPRLQPLALVQKCVDVHAVCDDGLELKPTTEQLAYDVETTPGSYSVEATLPLQLPARQAIKLAKLSGTMTALTPGAVMELKFDKLADANNVEKSGGGVTVVLESAKKTENAWEIRMKIRFEQIEEGFESHYGWVHQNLTYLLDEKGNKIDHVGYETTMENEREAGFLYLFEIEGDIGDYQWVYRTPTAIVAAPIEYELQDVTLP